MAQEAYNYSSFVIRLIFELWFISNMKLVEWGRSNGLKGAISFCFLIICTYNSITFLKDGQNVWVNMNLFVKQIVRPFPPILFRLIGTSVLQPTSFSCGFAFVTIKGYGFCGGFRADLPKLLNMHNALKNQWKKIIK